MTNDCRVSSEAFSAWQLLVLLAIVDNVIDIAAICFYRCSTLNGFSSAALGLSVGGIYKSTL
jgi:hypothetical protein